MVGEPDLAPIDTAVLGCLVEESGEVQQVVGKIMRHGYRPTDTHVLRDGRQYDNVADLNKECGDLLGAVDYAIEQGMLDRETVTRHQLAKTEKLRRIHG